MLQPIQQSNQHLAVDILARGLAKRSPAFWQASLARMHASGANAAADVPVGYFMMSGPTPVGIVLTPASLRIATDGRCQRHINLSSWYVEPDHRWRAPLMLRSVLRHNDAIYTDLTPTPPVQKILSALGFKPINAGEYLVALPQYALHQASRTTVVALDKLPGHAISPHTRALLESQLPFGCLAAAACIGDSWHPLLFKPCRIKSMPAVRLVYCEDNDLLRRSIGAVARHLLGHGKLFLILDMPLPTQKHTAPGPGIARHGHAPKFISSEDLGNRTDYAGSELCLFDL